MSFEPYREDHQPIVRSPVELVAWAECSLARIGNVFSHHVNAAFRTRIDRKISVHPGIFIEQRALAWLLL